MSGFNPIHVALFVAFFALVAFAAYISHANCIADCESEYERGTTGRAVCIQTCERKMRTE
ncbi:MAG: hypothetical protein GY871_04625 [Actinomycetales bacterium]|nr:hypothetical protein [Actinomycetales bacterium]